MANFYPKPVHSHGLTRYNTRNLHRYQKLCLGRALEIAHGLHLHHEFLTIDPEGEQMVMRTSEVNLANS